MYLQRTQQIQTKPGFLQRDYPFITHFQNFKKGSRITNATTFFFSRLSKYSPMWVPERPLEPCFFCVAKNYKYYKEHKDGSCVAFLDTLWHTGLLYELSEIEIPPKIWLILYRIYNNGKSCVFVNNTFSHYFRQHTGLCQGSLLSPKLYVLYINDLLNTNY